MKNIILLLILFSSCKTSELNQDHLPLTEIEESIAKQLIQGAFDDLWAGVDSTKIAKYHTEDFIILEAGEVWDNDRLKQFMRKQIAEVDRPSRTNEMDYLSIEKYGPSIQIAYYNYATFTRADTLLSHACWLESALAVPTKDGWRLKMMHSTWAGNKTKPK